MKKLLILILLIPLIVFSQEFKFDYSKDFHKILKRTQNNKNDLYYGSQIERFKKNDTTLTDFEVLALMIGYTLDENYHPYSDVTTEREIYKLNGNGEFDEAIKKGLEFYKTHPLNQMTLIELSYSYYKKDMGDSSSYFSHKYSRIMDAMANSGDGMNKDAAFFSLTPIDGQNFIRKYLGAEIGTMGSGEDSHGNFIDILEYISGGKEDNNSVSLYFQIEHATKEMENQIQNAIEKSE